LIKPEWAPLVKDFSSIQQSGRISELLVSGSDASRSSAWGAFGVGLFIFTF